MVEYAELLKEIERLPVEYVGEVRDFVGYLRQKVRTEHNNDIDAYKAMAADTEREAEAREWSNAYFGPAEEK